MNLLELIKHSASECTEQDFRDVLLDKTDYFVEIFDYYWSLTKTGVVHDEQIERITNKEFVIDWSQNYCIHPDAALAMIKFMQDTLPVRVLNVGTGTGASAALYSLVDNVRITSLDHLDEFTSLAQENLDILRDRGVPISDIEYKNAPLVLFKEHPLAQSMSRVACKKVIRFFKKKLTLVTYDLDGNDHYDFCVLDGPPCLRIPTMSIVSSLLDDGDFIMCEGDRKSVGYLKSCKVPHSEFGRCHNKPFRGHSIRAATFFKVSDLQNIWYMEQ